MIDHCNSDDESMGHRVTWFGDRPVEGGTVYVYADEVDSVDGGDEESGF